MVPNNQPDQRVQVCEKRIAGHRLWPACESVNDAKAIATIAAHLELLSRRIEAVREQLILEREHKGSAPVNPMQALGQNGVDAGSESDARSRSAASQLAEIFELLLQEDSLNLAAVAMVHARIREVIAESASDLRSSPNPANVRPTKTPGRDRAAFASSLATFVCQGSPSLGSSDFAMAVVDRTCELYAQLIAEASESPSR